MPCSGCKSILTQIAVILALGAALGIADSRFRPVKLDRATPPPIANTNQNPTPTPTQPTQPTTTFKPTLKKDMPAGQITLDEAKSLYDSQSVFVDARNAEKYAAGHIKGAYRISEEDFRSGDPAILAAIPRTATLVVYCSGGQCDESEVVARLLDGSGYKTIYVLHDGFPGWQAMGYASEIGGGIQ